MQGLLSCVVVVIAAAAAAPGAPQTTNPLKLDNVRLLVSRFDETFAFYRDVLGLQVTWGKPGENYASFAFPGGGQIALFRGDLMAAAVAGATPPLAQTRHDAVALILSSDDVDAA